MIIRTGGNSTAPRPPSFEENLNELGPPLQSPRMRTLVIVDAESVGVCATLRNLCESLRRVDFVSVAAHASPAAKISTAVAPASARSAPLDHVLVTIGLFVGQRGRSLWSPRARAHVICVDAGFGAGGHSESDVPVHRRTAHGRDLSARDRSEGRRQGAARGDAAARRRRRGVLRGLEDDLMVRKDGAVAVGLGVSAAADALRKRAGAVPGLRGGRRRARGPPGVSAFPRRRPFRLPFARILRRGSGVAAPEDRASSTPSPPRLHKRSSFLHTGGGGIT